MNAVIPTQDILVHTEAAVTTITLNRVDKKNSLTRAMYAALADALLQAQADSAVHVVVLQGDVTVFSAGNDIGDFLARSPASEGNDAPVMRFLRAEGHAVDHAPDAATAAEAMAVAEYACVILDLGLPDGSGLDVLKARRRAGAAA